MTQGWVQIVLFLVILTALVPLLGAYIARVFQGERVFLSPVFGPIERFTYRVLRVRPDAEQDWKAYARSTIVFSLLSWLMLYLILRTQSIQPFNPESFHSAPWNLSFNTTSSFVTNTNWQYYGGETTLTYFAQMAGLAVQNFVSAAVGIAVLAAVIRGFAARSALRARQLLGRPGPDLVLHPAADLLRRGAGPRLPGRDPDPRRLPGHPHDRRRHPDDGARARRLAGGDQGARHQRRRLLQRQQLLPVRELERFDQPPRAAVDPGDPGRPHLHLRANGRQPAPGLGRCTSR